MIQLFRNIFRYRELLWTLSESYLKARYKQTILGVGWAIIPPLLLMLTATVLVPHVMNIPVSAEPYPLFIYIGFWMWTFFSNALSFAIPNLVQNAALLRKVYFPREVLILAAIFPSILDFILGIPVLTFLLVYYHVPLHASVLLLPFVFLAELLLVFGLACAGSIINVAFRDVSKFLSVMLQVLLFATPVIYATENMSPKLQPYIAINPLTGIFNTARALIMSNYTFHWKEFLISVFVSIIVAYVGYRMFKVGERVIADIA